MNPILMTLLLLAGWGLFAYSVRRRWKLMMVGAADDRFDQPGLRLRKVWIYALMQVRMRRYPLAGLAHKLIFCGFVVLLLRSLILWGRGYDESFHFWLFGEEQLLGKIYSFLKDLFAVLVILGTLVFFYYRLVNKLKRLTHNLEALIILLIILVMMLADIFYDGAATAQHAEGSLSFVLHEPAGSIAAMAVQGLSDGALNCVKHAGFWTHVSLVLIFLNLLPYSKHFHVITAIPNIYLQDLGPPGRLPILEDIEGKLEREETLGIKRIDQFSRKSILDFYTCTECGRCSDYCPATQTGKKLSPKHFTIDLRDFLYRHEKDLVAAKGASQRTKSDQSVPQPSGSDQAETRDPEHLKDLVGSVIDPEVLWACTTCRACEQECPVFISFVDKIVDMRRYLVQEKAEFPKELQSAFRGLETNANPWSFPAEDRAKWAEGLGVKTLAEHPQAEVLFWVGCAPSYDDRAKKVARAMVKLMQKAGVDFAILGTQEQCTGDPARRAGNEFLFQMLAQANVEILNGYGVDKKKIVTTCPHCFNTLKNEYPDFDGHYDVIHHTTFLADLLKQGKLKPTKRVDKKIVYHDSCYLGRYNEVYDAPREALRSIPGLTVLEPEQTRDRGMCCGAGGAQMFKEEESGDDRVNIVRTQQLLDTKPDAISTACPFCMRMLTDGLAEKDREDVPQLDIAEILLESVGEETV
ncbi:MAG: 4Fe-4S dicluster domain-containing protein [Planctomycetes bacterium]|nr:4Fe-4S dicluster domain-containing protein [Planctomycetota bacterium]